MENQITQIAQRIKGLRQILDITAETMAEITGTKTKDYIALEEGKRDFSFTFLYKCAKHFGVDIAEILTGDVPKLKLYSVVKKGEGLPIKRREGFEYQHVAYLFKDKISEPFLVKAKYNKASENSEIPLSTHEGEEFDYVLKGTLKVKIENHVEILNEGDAIYYNSGNGHGMVAVDGDCEFLAVVMEKKEGESE